MYTWRRSDSNLSIPIPLIEFGLLPLHSSEGVFPILTDQVAPDPVNLEVLFHEVALLNRVCRSAKEELSQVLQAVAEMVFIRYCVTMIVKSGTNLGDAVKVVVPRGYGLSMIGA